MSNIDERLSKVNANDRRVKRTKKLLRDSLFTLLQEKSINEITVTELTEVQITLNVVKGSYTFEKTVTITAFISIH